MKTLKEKLFHHREKELKMKNEVMEAKKIYKMKYKQLIDFYRQMSKESDKKE